MLISSPQLGSSDSTSLSAAVVSAGHSVPVPPPHPFFTALGAQRAPSSPAPASFPVASKLLCKELGSSWRTDPFEAEIPPLLPGTALSRRLSHSGDPRAASQPAAGR